MNAHKFNLTQQIKTFGAIDVKHFRINHGALNEHFLIFANRFDTNKQKNSAIASNGVIYRYEHGKFAPIQILNFDSEIEQLLPVLVNNFFFLLFGLSKSLQKCLFLHYTLYRQRIKNSYCWYRWMVKQ